MFLKPFSAVRRAFGVVAATAALTLSAASVAGQHRPDSTRTEPSRDTVFILEPITVEGRVDDLTGIASSASVGYVGYQDFRLRPLLREGELMETIPGMILTQHSGSGKSNQMFVRGFNLDHGTDFSTRLEGMPLNFVTHAHGQGYTDINFLIPELVDNVGYALGTYYADIGDFGSAGGADIRLRQSLDRPFLRVGVGENAHRRIVGGGSVGIGDRGSLLVGAELRGYDGPWVVEEDLRKLSGMVRYTHEGESSTFSLLALGYDNAWDSSDQVPLRAVEGGEISRFGQIDPTLGGESSRYSLSARWVRSTRRSSQRLDVYAQRYDLDLFSNFTYLLDDPVMGDQIRQQDDGRWTFGANVRHGQTLDLWGWDHEWSIGAQLRGDLADVTLSRSWQRETVSVVRSDEVSQYSGGLFLEVESHWSDVVRTTLGLRGDLYHFDVTSDDPRNSGTADDGMVSPKASLIFGPWAGTEFYVSGGLGFHSNDARGTVTTIDPASGEPTEPVDPLVRSTGGEIGIRTSAIPGLRSTLSLWTVELDSELLFVGDAGTTEPSDASRRVGVTLANFYRFAPGWSADVDLSLTRARFLDVPAGEDRIPGALENVLAAGVTRDPGGDGVTAALRVRRFGTYPLIEDNSVRAQANTMANLALGYRLGRAQLEVQVLNAFDEGYSDIQYFYGSRLEGEPVAGIEDVHFHPAEPRQFRVRLSWGL
ncbi:MAG: TonB-dependent receptor [Gemmatimonadota bacterium]